MSLARNIKNEDIYNKFEVIKVIKTKSYNLADEISDYRSKNLR